MKRLAALGLLIAVGCGALASAQALAADVALVIGNRDYRTAPDAMTAEADARAVADALSDGGYDVTLGIDWDRREMRNQLSRFARKLSDADRVVIYYSGHAVRSDGVTYLAPVDLQNGSLVQVMMDGVPLDLVLRLAATRNGRAVVFIDAAQYDGFTPNAISEPGLAPIKPAEGVLVVSAAAPGRAIRRSDSRVSGFARDVVRGFLSPRSRAMDAARNLPAPGWYAGSVNSQLRLIRRGGRSGGSIGQGPADTPEAIESALGLTRDQRREIQESLAMLGHDPRGIDGVFGPGSRTAIRLWQRANNLTETGYMDAEQRALLLNQRAEAERGAGTRDDRYWQETGARGTGDGYRAYLARYSGGRHAVEAREALKRMARDGTDSAAWREFRDWRDVSDRDRESDYRAYLDRYPTGIWQPEAEQRLAEFSTGPGGLDPIAAEAALNLTRNDRLSVEQRLNYLGFPPGAQDGFFDSSTRWAIEGYQRSRGMEPTGFLNRTTLTHLVEETGGVTQGIIIDGAEVLRNILRGLE